MLVEEGGWREKVQVSEAECRGGGGGEGGGGLASWLGRTPGWYSH